MRVKVIWQHKRTKEKRITILSVIDGIKFKSNPRWRIVAVEVKKEEA